MQRNESPYQFRVPGVFAAVEDAGSLSQGAKRKEKHNTGYTYRSGRRQENDGGRPHEHRGPHVDDASRIPSVFTRRRRFPAGGGDADAMRTPALLVASRWRYLLATTPRGCCIATYRARYSRPGSERASERAGGQTNGRTNTPRRDATQRNAPRVRTSAGIRGFRTARARGTNLVAASLPTVHCATRGRERCGCAIGDWPIRRARGICRREKYAIRTISISLFLTRGSHFFSQYTLAVDTL